MTRTTYDCFIGVVICYCIKVGPAQVRALNEAKLAVKKEKAMLRHAERSGLNDQLNTDLSFAVHFNLAVQYHVNKVSHEAVV